MSFPEADRREAEEEKFPGLPKRAENALKQVVFQWKVSYFRAKNEGWHEDFD